MLIVEIFKIWCIKFDVNSNSCELKWVLLKRNSWIEGNIKLIQAKTINKFATKSFKCWLFSSSENTKPINETESNISKTTVVIRFL